jgi:hypothetical protein
MNTFSLSTYAIFNIRSYIQHYFRKATRKSKFKLSTRRKPTCDGPTSNIVSTNDLTVTSAVKRKRVSRETTKHVQNLLIINFYIICI